MHSNGQAQASKEPILKGDILIVDDKPDNLRFLSATLVERGYEVRCVLNGAMALTSARTTPPTLILLDIKMPELDGYEVCQQLKASLATSDIPVIFLSALDEAIDKVRAFAVGGVDYITKPFQVEEVIARIENQMAFQSAKAEILQLNTQLERRVQERTQELAEAKQQAEAANRAKDNFIAHMNHELRTPLNGILGFTQILQKDPHLTKQQNQNLSLIHQSGQHLLDLINDILNFSKIEADKIQLEEQDFNLPDFLDNLVAMLRLRAEQKNIDFHSRFSSSLPQVVRADETRLRQVLLNLISNAIKFTARGAVTFQVGYVEDFAAEAKGDKEKRNAISQFSIQNHQIRFQIKDTGIGIPEHKLADIFLPFEQVHQMQSEDKGTGLGLTISQKLLHLMGSQIQVTSTVGEGSIFCFDLDLLEGNSAHVHTTKFQSAIHPTGFSDQTRKVLIVDDLSDNRQLLVQYLQPLGFELAEAENGRQGLTLAETFKPDVILLDVLMPEMNGREMLQQLRQHPQLQETKVIFVSANSQFREQLQTSQLQFEDFLDKPVDFNQLLQSLQTHLQLQWVFPESTGEADSASLVAPPPEKLLTLWELAEMGDIAAIESQINSLEQLDSQYLPFVHQVRKLVESFQQNQLIKFLENLRDKL